MRGKIKSNNKGFSLVELIVVIAIMAVLVGILAPQLIKYVDKSRRSTDIKNVSEYQSAFQTYASDHETMAGTSATLKLTTTGATLTTTASGTDYADALKDVGFDVSTDGGSALKLKSKSWGDVTLTITVSDDMQPSFTVTNTKITDYDFGKEAGITATTGGGGAGAGAGAGAATPSP